MTLEEAKRELVKFVKLKTTQQPAFVEVLLNAIPAADVVEVVRCSECRHRDPEDHKCDCGAMERQGCPFPVDDDYYCSYGERKRRGREMFGWIFADLDTIIDCYSEPQKEETSDDDHIQRRICVDPVRDCDLEDAADEWLEWLKQEVSDD